MKFNKTVKMKIWSGEMLNVANMLAAYRLQLRSILQFCNQAQPQTILKKRAFVSNEVIYLTLKLFPHLAKCQFVNNRALFYTIHL